MKRVLNVLNSVTSLGGRLPVQATRLVRYATSGTLTALMDLFGLFFLVEFVGLYYIYSAMISFVLAHSLNYTINRNWGFKGTKSSVSEGYFYFIFFGIIGIIILTLSLSVLVELVGLHYLISKIIITASFGIFNFILNYSISFKMGFELFGWKKLKK